MRQWSFQVGIIFIYNLVVPFFFILGFRGANGRLSFLSNVDYLPLLVIWKCNTSASAIISSFCCLSVPYWGVSGRYSFWSCKGGCTVSAFWCHFTRSYCFVISFK
eukprot:TRINITY_DN10743_c1_g3_i1.p1 TRINITY_DN10743_c1_g3~~TRINITY_DN10743_c1_g3_i1.p1  ORF type:complete len:105 (-),score=6.91 TRINITY_DN10743_c1_g3_i1:985-1299(-)